MADNRGRHALDDESVLDEDRGAFRTLVAKTLLLGGRVLPVLTVAAVLWSRVTRDGWATASLDEAGFSTAWAPNLACGLSLALGFALPFILLPVGSSALAARQADRLTVATVLGRRTVDLATARAWRARLPGQGGGTQLVVLRSRTGWAILAASQLWLFGDYGLFDGPMSARDMRDKGRLALRGWVLMLVWVALIFVCLGVGGTFAGLF